MMKIVLLGVTRISSEKRVFFGAQERRLITIQHRRSHHGSSEIG